MNKKGGRNRQREGQAIPSTSSLSLAILMGVCHFLMLPLDFAVTSMPLGVSPGGPASVNTGTSTFETMQDRERKVCVNPQ